MQTTLAVSTTEKLKELLKFALEVKKPLGVVRRRNPSSISIYLNTLLRSFSTISTFSFFGFHLNRKQLMLSKLTLKRYLLFSKKSLE